MMDVYRWFNHEILAIPSITGKKTGKEKFAGAEFTLTNEDLMYNGVCLQDGTSHYFGQKFCKAYDVKFINKNNEQEYAYYTTWGKTTRAIAAIIMVHADDYGLVLPPRIAPKQVVIIPIGNDEKVNELCNKYKSELLKNDISCYIDNSDKTPGFKFAEAEVNGIPVRIEIGSRDLENNKVTIVRRDSREKITENADLDIVSYINELLETIQKDMYERAVERRDKLTFEAHNMEDMKKILNTQPGFIHAMWCGSPECETKIKEIKGCKSRCIIEEDPIDDKCVCCGKKADKHVIWGIQY
jgi:prolyl-tRNA synthetase